MKADMVIRNGTVVTPESTFDGGVAIHDGKFVAIGTNASLPEGTEEIDAKGKHILPGLIDGHVHFREPGMTHKEDFGTGSRSAIAGGITCVVEMPNTIPPVTHPEQVEEKKRLAEEKSLVDFALLGVIVQTNADQILPMARAGAVGYKIFFGETIGNLPFPDDGVCQDVFQNITESRLPLCIHAENRQIMYHHLNRIKEEGKTDPVNWESTRPAICEAESVHHAIFFAETFGTKMHVLHMSSKQAAGMVRDAKARGLRITAETGPHY
ncbi:MAG: dihydroorotase family protein, partial [Deltaproteobacteria bacterium]|nr:dihydroorotase family protein [Deltaproteobacteria bacterium]